MATAASDDAKKQKPDQARHGLKEKADIKLVTTSVANKPNDADPPGLDETVIESAGIECSIESSDLQKTSIEIAALQSTVACSAVLDKTSIKSAAQESASGNRAKLESTVVESVALERTSVKTPALESTNVNSSPLNAHVAAESEQASVDETPSDDKPLSSTASTVETAQQSAMPAGTVIANRYEIKSFLGAGGMSTVYKAWDVLIKRDVALKVLHPHLLADAKGALARFQREAQAVGKIDHQNIVKVHDFGNDQNGYPFLVMDFIGGKSLSDVLRNDGTLTPAAIVDIFTQACNALAHAHEKGVIHRDLKPSNIMLVGNQVKILDFGIAKILEGDDDLQLTRTGEVCGSPLYMSPEQCHGQKLDARSDIYSLGCLIYEAFAGVPPFRADSVFETLFKHMYEIPKSFASLRPDVKDGAKVEAIVLKCMAKKPKDRFQSMQELRAALAKLVLQERKGFMHHVKEQIELGQLRHGAQRMFTWKAVATYLRSLGIVLVLSMTIILALNIWHNNQTANLEIPTFLQNWQTLDVKGQEAFDNGDYRTAQKCFEETLDLAHKMRKPDLVLVSLQEMLDLENAREIIDPGLTKSKTHNGEKKKLEEQISALRQEQESSVAELEEELKLAQRRKPENLPVLCTHAMDTGMNLTDSGHHRAAMRLLKGALALAQLNNNQDLMSQCLFAIGHAYHKRGDTGNARKYYELTLKEQEKFLPAYDPIIARSLVHLARANVRDGANLTKTRDILNRALAIYTRAYSPISARVAWVHYYLALIDKANGDLDSATREIQKVIETCSGPLKKVDAADAQNQVEEILIRGLALRVSITREQMHNYTHLSSRSHSGKTTHPGRINRNLLAADMEKDIDQAIKLAEQFSPKYYVNDVLEALLTQKAICCQKDALRSISTNKLAPAPASDDYSSKLMQAKYRLTRALVLSSKFPSSEKARTQADLYGHLGSVARKLSSMTSAQNMYRKAVETSDKAFGKNSKKSLYYKDELNRSYRDSETIDKP